MSSAGYFKSHCCKQCGPRSDCSSRSSLIWVHTVCLYAKCKTIQAIQEREQRIPPEWDLNSKPVDHQATPKPTTSPVPLGSVKLKMKMQIIQQKKKKKTQQKHAHVLFPTYPIKKEKSPASTDDMHADVNNYSKVTGQKV